MFTVIPSGCSAAPPQFEAIVCCGECEDTDTMCDGCLSLALTSSPFTAAFLAVRFCSMLVR